MLEENKELRDILLEQRKEIYINMGIPLQWFDNELYHIHPEIYKKH